MMNIECLPEPKLTFDETTKIDILNFLGKVSDNEGFIVEQEDTTQRVLSMEGEEVTVDEFAGVQKGSEVFVKKDLISLMRLSKM